jgi:hypothetical protein
MNYALLKELMKQAESYANSKIHMTGWNYREEYNKKFAELIVRECADIASQCAEWAVQNPEDHILKRFDLYKTPAEIKAHFGVE